MIVLLDTYTIERITDMKLLKSKMWHWLDVGLLKISCTLFGITIGAYIPDFTKRYVWVFLLAAVLFAINPTISYLRNGK